MDDRHGFVSSGPDEHTVRNFSLFLGVQCSRLDFFDVRVGLHGHFSFQQGVIGVLVEFLIVGSEDMRGNIEDTDSEVVSYLGVQVSNFVVRKIIEFGRHLDPGRTSTHDSDVE